MRVIIKGLITGIGSTKARPVHRQLIELRLVSFVESVYVILIECLVAKHKLLLAFIPKQTLTQTPSLSHVVVEV